MPGIGRIFWRAVVASSPVLAWAAAATPADAQLTFRTVALSGRPAPGAPAGLQYDSFDPPTLNNSGHVAFRAPLLDALAGQYVDAIFAGPVGSPALVARTGQPAAGNPAGGVFGEFSDLTLNDAGQVAFTSGGAIYAGLPSSLSWVASGTDRIRFSAPTLNNLGQVAFTAGNGRWGGDGQVIHFGLPGAVTSVAATGDRAPGTPPGVRYGLFNQRTDVIASSFPVTPPRLNNAGEMAFSAWLGEGEGGWATKGAALYVGPPTSLTLVARTGDPAPGFPGNVYTGHLYPTALNDAGQVAFRAGPSNGETPDPGERHAIYAGSPGSVSLVGREGDQAPGTPEGVSYGYFGHAALNNAGQVAFTASLNGPGVTAEDYAVFSGSLATPSLGVHMGSLAPGAPPGIRYGALQLVDFNDAGQMAFLAFLFSANRFEGTELFVHDPLRGTHSIARTGALFDVGGGDLRRVDWAELRVADLSDDGRLAFSLSFDDGSSGVFVATVPEPAGLALVATGLAGLLGRRRRLQSRYVARRGYFGRGGTCAPESD